MKKVIDGKMYDTAKAVLLGHDFRGYTSDFHHWEECLYITANDRYFVTGSGGPMSRYGVIVGQNEWSSGSNLRAVSEREAREWMEQHCDADTYESVFDVEEA